jgi:hypothetical protein
MRLMMMTLFGARRAHDPPQFDVRAGVLQMLRRRCATDPLKVK